MDLYHVDIRLPDGYRLPQRTVELFWTTHAEQARKDDRYGHIPRIPVLNLATCETIEVGMQNGRVVKVVVRTELDDDFDIVFVLIPGPKKWTLKTVWLNEWRDSHKTLDRSRYMV